MSVDGGDVVVWKRVYCWVGDELVRMYILIFAYSASVANFLIGLIWKRGARTRAHPRTNGGDCYTLHYVKCIRAVFSSSASTIELSSFNASTAGGGDAMVFCACQSLRVCVCGCLQPASYRQATLQNTHTHMKAHSSSSCCWRVRVCCRSRRSIAPRSKSYYNTLC